MFLRFLIVLALALGLIGVSHTASARDPEVVLLNVQAPIGPVTSAYIRNGIDTAERNEASAVVLQMDTPGGLDTSMREIIQKINASTVPVIVYVSPSGGRAASAGTFITMAGHVAAMAPNTSIGAAHPVGSGGEDISGAMGDKVTNDAVSYIRGIATLRGRNETWAEQAVRESVSVPEYEAVQLNVVDLTANDVQDLLGKVDGRKVTLPQGTVTISTAEASVVPSPMTLFDRILLAISDPNLAFILLSLGLLGITFELLHPGATVPGVFGAIAFLLAFYALGSLPVNWAGVAFIFLAFVLFFLELFITSHGVLGLGGAISLAAGGLMLLSGGEAFRVSPWLVFGLSGLIAAFFIFVVGALIRSRRRRPETGSAGLIGRIAEVRTRLAPDGMVFVDGALWAATSQGDAVEAGEHVEVVEVLGLHLRVKPIPDNRDVISPANAISRGPSFPFRFSGRQR